MSEEHTVSERHLSDDNVFVRAYDVEELKEKYPDWEDFSDEEKCRILREEDDSLVHESSQHNITVEGLDELSSRAFDPNDTRPVVETMAIGTGDEQPEYENEELNEEEERFLVTTIEQDFNELVVVTFIGEAMANGLTITEIGLYSDDTLMNHSLVQSLEKDPSIEATYEVRLTFQGGETQDD